jgi:hypothetical protein
MCQVVLAYYFSYDLFLLFLVYNNKVYYGLLSFMLNLFQIYAVNIFKTERERVGKRGRERK